MQDYRAGLDYLDSLNVRKYDYYYNKAKLYCYLNLPDSAINYTLKYIGITKENSYSLEHIKAYNSHGLILKQLGRFHEAIKYW